MQDIISRLNALHRPSLLMRAAQFFFVGTLSKFIEIKDIFRTLKLTLGGR